MTSVIPTELFVAGAEAAPEAVEFACDYATAAVGSGTSAVAVDVAHTKRAADLLFGTGVGAVSMLSPAHPLRNQARMSLASGAAEVAVPILALDAIADLKAYLGSHTPLTIDVTAEDGSLDLSTAERALGIGADFVAFRPDRSTNTGLSDAAVLLALASEYQLGGVKLAAIDFDDCEMHGLIAANEWASKTGNSRVCFPVAHADH